MSGIIGTSHSKSKVVGKSQDTAKAWAAFSMAGTPAFKDSFGFSSLTDHSTGMGRVNFITAMPNDDYSAVASGDAAGSWVGAGTHINVTNTAYVSVLHVEDNAFIDTAMQQVIVFGD